MVFVWGKAFFQLRKQAEQEAIVRVVASSSEAYAELSQWYDEAEEEADEAAAAELLSSLSVVTLH